MRILQIHTFKCTDFKDAVLDTLQNNIKETVSGVTAALLRGSSNKMQEQSLQPQTFKTMTHTSKTHKNSLHDTRWFFVCFI